MTRTVLTIVVAASLLAATAEVFAHHSFTAAYDSSKRTQIEGIVKEFVWRNPHSFVRIDVTSAAGATETWNLEWGSISQLSAAKYPVTNHAARRRSVVAAGDRRAIRR